MQPSLSKPPRPPTRRPRRQDDARWNYCNPLGSARCTIAKAQGGPAHTQDAVSTFLCELTEQILYPLPQGLDAQDVPRGARLPERLAAVAPRTKAANLRTHQRAARVKGRLSTLYHTYLFNRCVKAPFSFRREATARSRTSVE
ncbi:hypothetical protein TRAPUB_8172 [Trametes pubescens]|uniref:Uncharacterized protein n=1 Tax=Trametes pubescens TaxID=154538 RepID=A0A1M2W680_TRAPU|nr:hypothetical protein TRAPUB_8172 [Trametes pubescens]